MADVLARYFPKPPRPLDDNHLRPVSDISPHPSRLQSLRDFLRDPNAQFSCPEQAILLELMCQGKESVLGILGTGKGKTMVVLLYAHMYAQRGVTVVVLPLSSLHDDFARRARERGVRAAQWSPTGKHNADVQIVYVSIEHMTFHGFQRYEFSLAIIKLELIRCLSYLQDLEHSNRLNLIVFDEIHKVLTDRTYRESFNEFWILNLVKTPIIGLDGSLPASCLSEFFSCTKTSWRVIRTSSNRLELGYEIRPVVGDLVGKIAMDIPNILSTYKKDDRLMVFCRSRQEVERLAECVGVPAFTSDTAEINPQTMDRWTKGDQKVMVSTSILGCGLDYPSVRHVLHCGIAYSMIDQHQQESRAGRDGEPAMAITYVPATQRPPSDLGSKDRYGLKELHTWAANSQQCLRIIQSLYLDGVAVTCLLLTGCTLCAYCSSLLQNNAPAQPQTLHHDPPALNTAPLQFPPDFTKAAPIPKRPSLQDALPFSLEILSDPIEAPHSDLGTTQA